ncbi:DNA topoisomerase 2-like isoform X2 [Varroa destructor]|nr:DNA topoisomerase 2-like isoform X2 [Varroa destructor]XP_022654784.1 DNA topoisomerase 2-like isoform X2 [Varroa destructor]
MWVYDGEQDGMQFREITYVPGLYKIFDEILVNAADNKQRDKNQDCVKIEIDPEKNMISVWNNGKGIPVVMHKTEKCYVPTLIFGHLLTSSNYNDDEKKVTGGRNGYGAKLCNIFSTKFTVETASRESKRAFKQTWTDNMTKTADPKIVDSSQDYTKVTFYPDLAKFKMETLDKDFVALISRRAYDVAGCTPGVKVFLNGTRLPIKSFKDYVQMFTSKCLHEDSDKPLVVVHESVNPRWEVACCLSPEGDFKQMSFVNNIATTKGGTHVEYVVDSLCKKLAEQVKKKNKAGVNIGKKQIRDHMWIFINCLIENPSFDSQTKENMTKQAKQFGSKCDLSEKFQSNVLKCGIVEAIMSWVQFKAQKEMNRKCSKSKVSKLKGIPKLEDANDAGTARSIDCTLILTEGDSAKTLAVSGLGVIGRDKYGVFPLKGKILNVREASHKQIIENAEINNIIKIVGLQYKKKYESHDDMKTLRYGRVMIMTDQDQDGSHIKGLLINFIHHNWPSLLKMNFLEEFITPIVKAVKGNQELSFFSLPEFEEWKTATPNWNTFRIKYYKGLGTSTAKEAKEYFSDMQRHRVTFHYQGAEDDSAITLAFSKKMIDERKTWLTNGMEERKQRRCLGLPEIYLYGKNTTSVSFNDFVHKELILFSNMDNERSIPSLIDGLKPGQRKVLFTCFKRNDKREVKVAQLAGSVAEMSAYHHGEQSLMMTIVNLAQNFVGSNNINLLQPIGQFGTRLQGGKDSASPRYIFTKLSPLARSLFPTSDDPVLNYLFDDNQKIEPDFYLPIIPMILVNGAEGIGTGWSTKVPNYNPREIVANIKRLINDEPLKKMKPWYKGFRGEIEAIDEGLRYVVHGELGILGSNKIEITELPIKTWTQTYKENVLESLLHGSDKVPGIIQDYKEYNTDTTIRFVVQMDERNLAKAEDEGLHKTFKLQTTIATTSMVLFDSNGCIRFYQKPEEILEEFFNVRLQGYVKRRDYLIGLLTAEADKLSNQARFILEKCDGRLVVENKRKKEMMKILVERGYDPDPMLKWKDKNTTDQEKEAEAGLDDEDEEEKSPEVRDDLQTKNYDYLLGMTMWNLTYEKKEELLKKRDQKLSELDILKRKTPKDLWMADLDDFLVKLEEVERKEREEQQKVKSKAIPAQKTKGGRAQNKNPEYMPSPAAERVLPKIDDALKEKIAKATKPKGEPGKRGRAKKELNGEENGNGDIKVESGTPVKDVKPRKKSDGMKQTKLAFKKKNFSESDDSDQEGMFEGTVPAAAAVPERQSSRRAASTKIKYNFSDDDSDNKETAFGQDSDGEVGGSMKNDYDDTPPKKTAATPRKEAAAKKAAVDDSPLSPHPPVNVPSDSDSDDLPPLSARAKKVEFESPAAAANAFDALMGSSLGGGTASNNNKPAGSAKKPPAAGTAKSKAKPKKKKDSEDEDDFDDFINSVKKKTSRKADSDSDFEAEPKPKGKAAATITTTTAAKKRPAQFSDGEDAPVKKPPQRARKKMYVESDDDDDDFNNDDNDSDY